MNGLASLLRYQMGGPVGYVTGGQIDDIYNTLFGRSADADGRKFYEEKLKNASVADAIAIIGGGATGENVDNEDLRQKIAGEVIKAAYENVLGRPEDVAGLQFYQDQVLNQGLDPTQIDDIFADSPEAQVRKDAEEFLRRLEAGEDVTGIGVPLDASQFTTPITQKIAADLIGRAQTGGVLTSEFDQYGGYDAVKNVYDASGGAGPGVVTDDTVVDGVETIDLPTRTTPPNVDTTNLFTSTGDTRAVTGPPVPDYGYINDLYKTYFGRDASPGELASYAGIFGPTIEPNEIKDFILGGVTSKEITQDQADILLGLKPDPVKIAAETEAANAEGRPGAGQILGIPTFARQTPSDLTFAPLRRGLGQLRPAMSMTGLTSGQAAFGGVAPTPGQSPPDLITAQDRAKELIDRTYRTVLNRNPTQVGYDFYLPKILSGELNANNIIPTLVGGATSGPDKEVAANYAIQNPSAAQPFTLQTGAYGAPTPTFFTPTPAKTTSPSGSSSANANQPGSIGGSGPGGDGFSDGFGDPSPSSGGTVGGTSVSGPAGATSDSNAADDAAAAAAASEAASGVGNYEVGGLIRMAEGGEPPTPPPMSKLSAKEAGSTFDINDYIEKGILVGGMSKPIRDEYGMIIGYKSDENDKLPLPIQRDVVFGRELRDKEAAMRLTDAEREQMMIEMAMRQGRTGISPTTGGLAGISTDNLMPSYMRRQPQYYSPAEQFRPRYAEGGNVSSTAQDLASRGRGGDTMLVHMAPHEVTGLNALARMQGTELTINPETGMPEALKLGKLFKTLAPFIPFIPGVGQFLAPAFGALGMGGFSPLLQKAITSGVIGGFTGPKGGFDLQRGLMQGITAYGLGSLQQNLAGPSTPTGTPTGTAVSPEFGAVDSVGVDSANPSGIDLAGATTPPDSVVRGTSSVGTDVFNPSGIDQAGASITETVNPNYGTYSDTAGGIQTQPRVSIAPETTALGGIGEPMKTPTALLTTGLGLSSTADYDKLTSAGIAVKREKEEEDELYRRLFERSLGAVPVRSGGLMKLAGGGMSYMEAGGTTGPTGAPRDVVGTGDGMSDSVPADIEGVQEARLADGEFVIPADVVADIGNGSSDAGSKKLYDMMDRVRMARHDTTKQPPEIKAERLMPA
jgi:hypothetical protein